MKRIGEEILRIILTAILIIAFVFLVSLLVNSNNKNSPPLHTNSVTKPLDTATNTPMQVNEDDDVYGQRQLRADYNTGSSSEGY